MISARPTSTPAQAMMADICNPESGPDFGALTSARVPSRSSFRKFEFVSPRDEAMFRQLGSCASAGRLEPFLRSARPGRCDAEFVPDLPEKGILEIGAGLPPDRA